MRISIASLLVLGIVALSPLGAQQRVSRTAPPALAQLTGEWIFVMEGDPQPQRVRLEVDGDSLTGRVYGMKFSVERRNDRLRFGVGDYVWRGSVGRDSLSGWLGIGTDSTSWFAFRSPVAERNRTWVVEAREFPRAFDPAVPPVQRIFAGDTVVTHTLDAGGNGAGDIDDPANHKSPGGNPLVGPFYVEGAVPGDVIAVTLLDVSLDRDWAFSGTALVDNAVEPAYAAERKGARVDDKWTLDRGAGVARLRKPSAALANYSVPLTPFLGVIATAPRGPGVPSSRESGRYGGNLEYARFRSGTTVLLPVSQLGAQLYVGDGHAAQGDGELTGDAMETSMAVRFTVQLVRWGFQSNVRARDAESLMSLGVGGSLDEALRMATSDLARWLGADYGLDAPEVALVMGTAVEYDIPDVVPPGYGVVARIARRALDGVGEKR